MKLDILAFAAHPDDVELSASGTIIKHIALGRKVGIVDLTRGELGSRGTADIRDEESAAAAELMGLSARENLRLADGFFRNDKESQLAIIRAIRKYQPEIVLCNSPSDRHPDHGKGSQLVLESTFLSGLQRIETGQAHWRPRALYHYIQDRYLKPDFIVDISAHIEDKIKAIMCYKSQFFNPDSTEAETPISSLAFLEFIRSRAREMGRQAGFEFGEGFIAERFPGVQDLFDLH